jgi:hypothetical chaperone protein
MYIADNMRGRLIQSLKSLLPDITFTHTWIHGKKYEAEDLVATLLRYFKQQADKKTGVDADRVVIGRPARFSDCQEEDQAAEERLRKAATDAGFKHVAFQLEPIAAALSYEARLGRPEVVLVGDIGAGTSDYTLMRLDPQARSQRDRSGSVIGTGGCHIGGDDFDAEIMWHKIVRHFGYGIQYEAMDRWLDIPVHIYRQLCKWERIAFLKDRYTQEDLRVFHHNVKSEHKERIRKLQELINHNLGFSLFKAIEAAKITLSEQPIATVDFNSDQFSVQETITEEDFRRIIDDKLSVISDGVSRFLSSTSISDEDIGAVFLTGGSSLVPDIRSYFVNRFGVGKVKGGDTFTSVCKGLALTSSLLFGAGEQFRT